MSLKGRLAEYRQTLEHEHGWEVELECTACGYKGPPVCKGWQPKYSMSFGMTPTIFARLECPACGRDLEPEAATILVKLFAQEKVPKVNRRILIAFIATMAVVVLVSILLFVFTSGMWGLIPLFFLTPLLVLIPILNYRVASLRSRCDCGDPRYIFMGLLGRAYCYRCSNCGRLLKLRD
jgi:hypothetical protein